MKPAIVIEQKDIVAMICEKYGVTENADENEFDAVEWGTLEGGKLDRKVWDNRQAQ